MHGQRRFSVLSCVVGFFVFFSGGATRDLMAQADVSVTELCAGEFRSEGQWAGFNADTVSPTVSQPGGGTNPAIIEGSESFCTRDDGPFNSNTCARTGRWSFAVGDDFPLNTPGSNPLLDCDYRFGPGGFPLSTVADWSDAVQFCMVVTNCDNAEADPVAQRNSVSCRAELFSSLGNTGVALQIRTFAQSEEVWIAPGETETVCIDFSDAQVQPTFTGGQTVPNTANITGFAFEFGAFTPFTEQRSVCWDGNPDNNPTDCLNRPPAGNGLNRESDDVCVQLRQPRPQMRIPDEDRRIVFCNGGVKGVTICNDGTGTLFITKAILGGANSGEFEAQQSLAVPAGECRDLPVRYNNREVDLHLADLRFESNALNPADNMPIDPDLPQFVVDLRAFSTLAQTIATEQRTANVFTARTILHISEFAPTGFVGSTVATGIPQECAKVTQITSIASRFGYDSSKIRVTAVEIGRPTAEPNGAAPGVDTTDLAPLPCCVTDNTNPPRNESVEWDILFNTLPSEANAQQRLDIVAGDSGGVVLDTDFYVNSFPLVGGSDPHVLVECFSADFELVSFTGCNTASVFFAQGPSTNFFPAPHQSNVGHNPDVGTAVLQDVGAKSARSLGVPPNSFVRGDVDFSAQANANDIVRLADVVFNTDGSEAQVAARIGRACVAAVDLTVDKSIDIRDLLTLIQLLFNVQSNIRPEDVVELWNQAGNQNGATPVAWPGAGYERLIPNPDDQGNLTRTDPTRFTCAEGLLCEENGV